MLNKARHFPLKIISPFFNILSNERTLKCRFLSTSCLLQRRRNDEEEFIEIAPPSKMHPAKRTLNILRHDVRGIFHPEQTPLLQFSTHVDLVVIGGGMMGTAIAYYMKQRTGRKSFTVMVIEKDPTYTRSSTVLSLGGIRQQFSLKENIQMSIFGAEFLRKSKDLLSIEGVPPPDIQYHPYGYLYLADQKGASQLQENWLLQKELGAEVELLSQQKLKERFPWINADGIEVACHGMENEGWFDAWALQFGMKRKACALGAEYVEAEVAGFVFEEDENYTAVGTDYDDKYEAIKAIIVKTPTGELKTVHFGYCIVAAGHESTNIAYMARIGRGEGILSVPLPVEPRKRYVFCYNAPEGPGLDCPMVIDPSGTYFRREGYAGHFVAGRAPPLEDEPNIENLDVDYTYFDKMVYPELVNRVPGFKNLKLNSGWAGYYDYNTFDENGIVGPHPYYSNLYFSCGFSGFGIQQAPGAARGIMEMILDGEFKTADLTRFHFERFLVGKEIREKNVT